MILLKLRLPLLMTLISVLMLIVSCNLDSNNQTGTSNKQDHSTQSDNINTPSVSKKYTNIEEPGTTRNDTIYISGKYILFYGPSNEELTQLNASGELTSDFEAQVVEFDRLHKPIIDSLLSANSNINSSFTSHPLVCITMEVGSKMYFNIKDLKYPMGMIIMDGMQLPKIYSGNNTIGGYNKIIKEYFISSSPLSVNNNYDPHIFFYSI
jgi:hypothetical protein